MGGYTETILLVEPDEGAVRTVVVTQRRVMKVYERLHLDPKDRSKVTVREWRNMHNEFDRTHQLRVFREVLPAPPEEPPENPIYQETELKTPIPMTDHESPLGWIRKR